MAFFRTALGLKSGAVGAVMAIQTFGDYGRWHPHLHILVADGLFLENGSFCVMTKVDLQPLQELFRTVVLKMLKKEGKIGDELEGGDLLPAQEVEVLDVAGHMSRRVPSETWRECIRKIWEVDPLECPHCKAEMKIVSFLNEETVIRRLAVAGLIL